VAWGAALVALALLAPLRARALLALMIDVLRLCTLAS